MLNINVIFILYCNGIDIELEGVIRFDVRLLKRLVWIGSLLL